MPDPFPTSDGLLSFEQWLDYCFDRESDRWHWDHFDNAADQFGAPLSLNWYRPSAPQLCEDLTRLFSKPGLLVDRYSPEQLGWGFWFVFGIGSEYMNTRLDPSVAESAQVGLVESILTLYQRLFAPLCGDLMADDPDAHPVRLACYMLWDMDCLWPPKEPQLEAIKEAQFRVLERALWIRSDAVRESALHGLGDTHYLADPERVRWIIDRFLATPSPLRPELERYALAAREGRVQ